MALSVRSLASSYSSQCLDKLSRLLLSKNSSRPSAGSSNYTNHDFDLDLEVVYDSRKKVSDIIIK